MDDSSQAMPSPLPQPHVNIPLAFTRSCPLPAPIQLPALPLLEESVECVNNAAAGNNSTARTAASATTARPLGWIYRLRLTPSLCLSRPFQVITPTKSRWNLRLMTSSALTKRYFDLTPSLTTRSMKPYNNLPPFPLFAQHSNGQTPFSDRLWVSCSQGRLLKKLGKSLPRASQGLGPRLISNWSSLLVQRAPIPPQIYK